MTEKPDLKEDIRRILHPEKFLKPPPAPRESEIPVAEESVIRDSSSREASIIQDSKLSLDFSYLTQNSSFQRAIIEFIKKNIPGFENVNPRGSKEVMVKSFNANATKYRDVMNEFKEKVRKIRNE